MKAKEIITKVYKTRKCTDCPKRIDAYETYCVVCWFKRAFDSGLKITITA